MHSKHWRQGKFFVGLLCHLIVSTTRICIMYCSISRLTGKECLKSFIETTSGRYFTTFLYTRHQRESDMEERTARFTSQRINLNV